MLKNTVQGRFNVTHYYYITIYNNNVLHIITVHFLKMVFVCKYILSIYPLTYPDN